MYRALILVCLVVGVCATVLVMAIWLADNRTVSRRFCALCCSAVITAVYDWFFVTPIYSLAVNTTAGYVTIGLVFAITATVGELIMSRR
jgi:K+-sensing histidine kinase KdpD